MFPAQAPGLKESTSAKAIETRHEAWKARLPADEKNLWGTLTGLDSNAQAVLLAHCASFAVNALYEPANRYNQGRVSAHSVARRLDRAGVLARAVGLDMVQAGWKPTVDNYLGRVTKQHILEAVREAKGEASAQLIDHLKKADMASEAERLLDGAGWLPEPLRHAETGASTPEQGGDAAPLPEFLADGEDKPDNEDEQPSIAAE
jgi:ParB family chromosome partitioning protein